jgi:UDP-2,3-diacylglucosamine hydrolase
MAQTLFLSDLHLDESRPQATQRFLELLRGEAASADALYILGDLFEYWIGDDVETALSSTVANALRDLSAGGTACCFIHGNRDFMLGEDYARRCGMQLLAEETVVDLYGQPALLMHGDQLCTDDVGYQRIRTMVRDPAWQADLLRKTPAERIAFARDAREQSATHKQGVSEVIMDVNDHAVANAFRRHGVTTLIHGHTHRPAVHELSVKNHPARRIVLGDWYTQGSMLRVTPGAAWTLTPLPFN